MMTAPTLVNIANMEEDDIVPILPVLARYHAKAIILFLSGGIHSDSDAEGL